MIASDLVIPGQGLIVWQILGVVILILILYILYRILKRFNILTITAVALAISALSASCINQEDTDISSGKEELTVEKVIEKYNLQTIHHNKEGENARVRPDYSLKFETAEEADFFLELVENDIDKLFQFAADNPEKIINNSPNSLNERVNNGPDNPLPSGPNAASRCFDLQNTIDVTRLCIVLGWSESELLEARAVLSGWTLFLSYENLFSNGSVSGDLVNFSIVGKINVNIIVEDIGTIYSYAPGIISGDYNKATSEWSLNPATVLN